MNLNWYNKGIQAVSEELSADVKKGLSKEEAAGRIEKYGYNELKEKEKEPVWVKIGKQLKDFLVVILIIASIVSGMVGEISDAIVIIAIVIVNAVLGVVQEGKAEKAMEALKKMSAPNARVLRSGHIEVIPARNLVPGDIVFIEAGDSIPADIRLIESINLKVEEASLTGESVPSEKDASKAFDSEVSIGDRLNMAYMSTIATYGRGKGIVVNTGTNTEIGRIAEAIQTFEDETTPLQKKLNELGKWLGLACLIICVIVFAIGFMRGGDMLEMFLVSVSLAVAAIPEGLPAVVTIVLALGMKRMVQRNAIVRKLLAVETLGCVTVICSDKTGTLTQNEMTVVRAFTNGNVYKISGQGYNPAGEITFEDGKIEPEAEPGLKLLLSAGVLCNDSALEQKDAKENLWGIVGDPTEGALVVAGAKAGYDKAEMNEAYVRIGEIPFDSERKMMTTFHDNFIQDRIVSFTKGAPDIILGRCAKILQNGRAIDMTEALKQQIAKVNSEFAGNALRVLAFTYREYDKLPESISSDEIENDLIFVGLMGMIDPARVEAFEAIKTCKEAGIKPVMITGDHKDTAVAIARELGLMEEHSGVLTGNELDKLSDEELFNRVENTSVYARVSPEHKVRIVEMLKKRGHIAAMTGDGVNDAMALKKANIGVSMGITGTDVAKGTADIILMDDNFATIVSAVEEGRIIYGNIRKFVFFLLSCNIAEIFIIFLSILFNMPIPLVPIQLLWLNLVSDSFPALALGTEMGEPGIMKKKPRDTKEPILNKSLSTGILILSIAQTAAVLIAFRWALNNYNKDLETARTLAFTTIVVVELFMAFTCRSERYPVIKLGIFSNRALVLAVATSLVLGLAVIYIPFLQPIFKTVSLGIRDWVMILILSIVPVLTGEIYKLIVGKTEKTAQ
ncbi:MAG TPA: calcium-translocating P-type ATPase, SERCA-type [Bacillota bacterium]|nr:calcium-translocating P-type ATPase, SERCA-type [Bacillota bacterium]